MDRKSEGKSSGIPHLAKNERDMAHPSFVREPGHPSSSYWVLLADLNPAGLQVRNLHRAERTGEQIAEGSEISAKPSQPVHVGLRLQTPHQILQAWADDKPEHMRPGKRPFARKVDRIGHLRVTHAHSGGAADLDAEGNSARIREMNDQPKLAQLA